MNRNPSECINDAVEAISELAAINARALGETVKDVTLRTEFARTLESILYRATGNYYYVTDREI